MRDMVVRAGLEVVGRMNVADDNAPQNSTSSVVMSDGKKLHTRVSLPYPYDQKRPAVLDRSPYAGQTAMCDLYLGSGFAAVSQEQRGTALSGGQFDLWRGESQDAQDTVEWILDQPWSNGEVYTVGISADGIGEAVIALTTGNSHLKGQWWGWTTGNAHRFIYPSGMYREDTLEGYLTAMNPLMHFTAGRVKKEVRAHENWSDWYDKVTLCRIRDDPTSTVCHYNDVSWPTVHTVGWFDIFRQTHLESFMDLRSLGDESARDEHVLVVAPLGHCSLMSNDQGSQSPAILYQADADSIQVSVELTTEMFSGSSHGPVRSRLGRVNLYIMGGFDGPTAGNYWTSLDEFPVSQSPVTYFLHDDGSLANSPQDSFETVTYQYDPSDPTPMLGANNLPGIGSTPGCGTHDQSERESRSDVVSWDTEALADDMPIVGSIVAKLSVSSDAKDTDFVVTITDVSPDGKSMLLTHGAVRMRWRDGDETESSEMTEGNVYSIDVVTDITAYIFPKGHRVRITVASAAAPYFEPNSNTGIFGDTSSVVASNSVHGSSSVMFPVVDISEIPENPNFLSSSLVLV